MNMKRLLCSILAAVMVLAALPAIPALALEDIVFTDSRGNRVVIPGGAASCATRVVEFTKGNPWSKVATGKNENDTLGAPDYNERTDVGALNLGRYGVLVLEFDIYITDTPGVDIYVFEVGSHVEATKVEVSNDLATWIHVGDASGSTSGVDMAGKVPAGAGYRYVRITDINGRDSDWPGADIDAVAGNITAVLAPDDPDPTPPPSGVTLTPSSPSATVNVGAGSAGRVPVTVSGGDAVVQSSGGGSADPTLYNASGSILNDDGAGGLNFRYNVSSGQTVYAGEYYGGAATYTVTATFDTPSASGVTLTPANPSATITVGAGAAGRVPVTVSGGGAVVRSSGGGSADPALYDASGGTLADDLPMESNFGYRASSGQTVYAGTYGNSAATYTVTATFGVTSVTLTPSNPSAAIIVGEGAAGRVPVTISGGNAVLQSSANSIEDPTLYNASGGVLDDDGGGAGYNFRYNVSSGQTVYAGECLDGAAAYTVTATFDTSAPGTVRDLLGVWEGSYGASQGETGMTLEVYEEAGEIWGIWNFYNLPGRTNAKEGATRVKFSYNQDTGVYTGTFHEWIVRPSGYNPCDLNGTVSGDVFSGDVSGGGGTTFRVVKVSGSTPTPTTPHPNQIFNDNNSSQWAREELTRAFEEDLIPLSLLDPNKDLRLPITRAEFAGIAVLTYESLSGDTILPAAGNPFTDTWDVDVLRAYNAEVMVGVSDDLFDPDAVLTREQAATALTRVFKRWHFSGWSFANDVNFPLQFTQPAPFADDAAISDWAREGVYFMYANGIIQGMGNNIFAPRAITSEEQSRGYAIATREQAILIALRMVENQR